MLSKYPVDIVVWDKSSHQLWLFEVKRTESQDINQSKHLRDQEYLSDISERYDAQIVGKTVLYRGADTQQVHKGDVITYRNILSFISEKTISRMLTHTNWDPEGRVTDIQAEIERARRMVQGSKKTPSSNPDNVGTHDER